jgi:hypothetical protein
MDTYLAAFVSTEPLPANPTQLGDEVRCSVGQPSLLALYGAQRDRITPARPYVGACDTLGATGAQETGEGGEP